MRLGSCQRFVQPYLDERRKILRIRLCASSFYVENHRRKQALFRNDAVFNLWCRRAALSCGLSAQRDLQKALHLHREEGRRLVL